MKLLIHNYEKEALEMKTLDECARMAETDPDAFAMYLVDNELGELRSVFCERLADRECDAYLAYKFYDSDYALVGYGYIKKAVKILA